MSRPQSKTPMEPNEDQQLQEEIELLVKRVQDPDQSIQSNAIELLRKTIRGTNSTSTTIPKTTKYLRPHLDTLKAFHAMLPFGETSKLLADVLSVLVMTSGEKGESLKYKQLGHLDDLGQWGHEYTRNLTGEVVENWQKEGDKLKDIAKKLVEFHVEHNAEQDAIDFCIETDTLEMLEGFCERARFEKVFVYATSCATYYPEPEDKKIYNFLLRVALKQKRYTDAVRLMLKTNDFGGLNDVINANKGNNGILMQMGYILSRVRDDAILSLVEDETVKKAMVNENLSAHFTSLVKALALEEIKTPQQICTTAPPPTRLTISQKPEPQESKELGLCVANCLANAGFGYDSLIHSEDGSYVVKARSELQVAAAAGMGLLHLWRPQEIEQFTTFTQSDSMYVRAGALLGIGTCCSGVKSDVDFAQVFLADKLTASTSAIERKLSIFGLGLSHAGSRNAELKEQLIAVLNDITAVGFETAGHAAIALGMIYEGSMDGEIADQILSIIFSNDGNEEFLKSISCKMLVIGLGLLHLCCGDASTLVMDTVRALPSPVNQYAMLVVCCCSYAGTSNIVKVQQLMEGCGKHDDDEETKACGVSVIGVALALMSDDLSTEASTRLIDEVQRYSEPAVKRYVPFALALTSIGKPKVPLLEQLTRLAHGSDIIAARNAILAIGLVAAGTQATRAVSLLDQLACFFVNDHQSLYCVKVSQGLIHLGKGTIGINPMYMDRFVMDPVALSGLLTFILIAGEGMERISGLNTYIINSLCLAMRPRMFMPIDDTGKVITTSCRVGVAVDVAGQAGTPKTITGFQTHNTPVLIGVGERAELAAEDYSALSSVLEGVVVLKHN
ncbi:26S proteasome non-ATPase regulatory subunit, putative [Entamoeba invadens IP1]|uniref:26S proteasome non-ATPase regulatory subunit, putative n=1 Tax=Entamoeba invadens IP1 TaxID=370355 RepID=A0A0A1UFL4_ENTIV|nr:26S proteasome non-ATPase regulatory subunit, putative [Entamoeba invadens IP1]ELP92744.1 26S proteasome non-ATPase regulatory subunit, putative [Entamoeba invadens IP1]|eukprot:XP_004259515.1 26S proteasome non-ATPase regulatory subunit, putative [Entamoeba invadens IP1]